jgi:hypothetical protein
LLGVSDPITNIICPVNATTLTLDNLFRSIPTLSKIYTTLQINDSALNELFLSPMKNPEEFLKLMSMTDPYKYFCENQKHWHIIFVIGSDTPSKICSGNSSDILEKLVNDLGSMFNMGFSISIKVASLKQTNKRFGYFYLFLA